MVDGVSPLSPDVLAQSAAPTAVLNQNQNAQANTASPTTNRATLSVQPRAFVPGAQDTASVVEAAVNAALVEAERQAAVDEVVNQLRLRDAEVRSHEERHAAIGGPYTGAPVYTYVTGPDGGRYAVAGSVSVDLSEEATPEQTIDKMETIQAAAFAPAGPSGQDRAVAIQASRIAAEARAEIQEEERRESAQAEREREALLSGEVASRSYIEGELVLSELVPDGESTSLV